MTTLSRKKKKRSLRYSSKKGVVVKFFLAALALAHSATALEPFSFERSGGSTVCGYLTTPKDVDSFPILILLQGGEKKCIQQLHLLIEPLAQGLDIGMITLEKWGNESGNDEEQDWETYYLKNTVEQRYCDHAHLMDLLREGLVPGWDHRIAWMGGSEGACLAPYLAPNFPETSALMIYAGSGARSYYEDSIASVEKTLRKNTDVAPLCFFSRLLAPVLRDFGWYAEMISADDDEREHLQEQYEEGEMPTRQYLSCARMPPLTRFVAATSCPVLCVHGTEDEILAVEGADAMVRELQAAGRDNLTYWRMEGADHVGIYGEPYFGVQKGFEWLGEVLSSELH